MRKKETAQCPYRSRGSGYKPDVGIVNQNLTLTSISPILFAARMIGLPTIEGKMCAGKLEPA
jgi:hypothetical protein